MKNTKQSKTVIIKSFINDSTCVVENLRTVSHKTIGKVIKKTKKYIVKYTDSTVKVGDQVEIFYTRPKSKRISWQVVSKGSNS